MFGKNRDTGSEKLDTVIGGGASFKGNLIVEGTLRVDGRVEGEINVQGDVMVGKSALVRAVVRARNAAVAGEVHGDITLEGKLELDRTGKVFGDIEVAKLVVQEGALFRGQSKMTENGTGRGKPEKKREKREVKDKKDNKDFKDIKDNKDSKSNNEKLSSAQ